MTGYSLLVYMALIFMSVGLAIGGWVVYRTEDNADLEHSKVRFAAATFVGILLLIVFTAVLYFVDASGTAPSGAGQAIFETTFTAMTPIAGGIIGYLFASKKTP